MSNFIANASSDTLSRRGILTHLPIRPAYQIKMMERSFTDRFDKETNKNGAINMLFAENQLMWKEMEKKISEVTSKPMPNWVSRYNDFTGETKFKETLCKLMEKYWTKCKVEPGHLAV